MSATTYPVRVTGRLDPHLSRWMWLVKWFLAIPHYVVLAVLWVVFGVLNVIAFVAILVTGRYPRSLFDFNVGVLRWSWRVSYYAFGVLGTDRYPPFTLADVPDYPARLEVAYPEHLSRLLVLVKWWLLAIPQYLVVGLLLGGGGWAANQSDHGGWAWSLPNTGLIGILALVAVVVLAVTDRYPQALFDLLLGLNRWVLRVAAYAGLMTDAYPPFRLDMGGEDPGGALTGAGLPSPGWPSGDQSRAVPAGSTTGTGAWPVPPDPRRGTGRTGGHIAAIVIGALLVVLGLGLLSGGAALGWLNSHRDRDGFLTTGTHQLATPTAALSTERLAISVGGAADWLYGQDRVGTVRIHATSTTGAPVFIGVAPQANVDRYLGSAAHDRITNVSLTPFRVTYLHLPGTAALSGEPASQSWTASAAGPGEQALSWRMTDGQWAVVVANADGSPGVDVRIRAAAQVPGLGGIAVGLAVAGIGALGVGIVLIVAGARRPDAAHRTAAT